MVDDSRNKARMVPSFALSSSTAMSDHDKDDGNHRPQIESSLSEDLLEGADAIAIFIWNDAAKRVKVYRYRRKSRMPLFTMGGKICALKSTLREWIREQERRGWHVAG